MRIDPFPGGQIARVAWAAMQWFKQRLPAQQPSPLAKKKSSHGENTQAYIVSASTKSVPKDSPLYQIFTGLLEFPGVEVYVHGSWADNTKTPFSDLDDLIIVDTSVVKSTRQLRELFARLNAVDMRFCRLDPLQHHGHWIIEAVSLEAYDESFLPLTVLDGAICLQGQRTLTANVNCEISQTGLWRNLDVTLNNIEYLHHSYLAGTINLYETKRLIGSILLVPAYVFQIHGHRVSKRYAIEHADTFYGRDALAAISTCSVMRSEWGRALIGWRFKVLRIGTFLIGNPHFYRRIAARLSPAFPKNSFIELSKGDVAAFVRESRAVHNGSS